MPRTRRDIPELHAALVQLGSEWNRACLQTANRQRHVVHDHQQPRVLLGGSALEALAGARATAAFLGARSAPWQAAARVIQGTCRLKRAKSLTRGRNGSPASTSSPATPRSSIIARARTVWAPRDPPQTLASPHRRLYQTRVATRQSLSNCRTAPCVQHLHGAAPTWRCRRWVAAWGPVMVPPTCAPP